ncbi:hypothetical protein NsoK4_04395 [Nitrosopumilus sp. K4]|uniref:DUF4443 domain-containing protein n=1 Tax=Nitrosopumilus sp. K4 TaxID=2795383 RepID=UPI001BA93E31|nr:DUF4443 domain-containing protein [Nitrosopumilus sp. K4]QUC65486.1 hypothetical protein NsoK4_04395 [Nitrosopumilus sp. K4]
MKKNIETLQNIVSRKGSSKILTFSIPHVFKALQMLSRDRFVSRATFCKEIHLGEGAVKTLISHLKEAQMVESTKSGTFLTNKGKKFIADIQKVMCNECVIKKSDFLSGKFNHAVLLKKYSKAIKTGLEQRDYAILYGSSGCTTILFKNNHFVFPDEKDCFSNEPSIKNTLQKELSPEEEDVIIISSSDDPFVAEISAKNSALWTLATT